MTQVAFVPNLTHLYCRRQGPDYTTSRRKYNRAMPRIYLERRDLSDDLRRLFDLLDGESQSSGHAGECTPPLDVVETTEALEIIVDLPGVTAEQIQIVFARGAVLITGLKRPLACSDSEATFHLAERAFGRFGRVIRLSGAVDAGAARATLAAGELRIVLPRLEERRGAHIRIPIETR